MAVIEIVGGVILLVVSVVIFALTLMQHTHGQGLAGVINGSAYGANSARLTPADQMLAKATRIAGIIFFVVAILPDGHACHGHQLPRSGRQSGAARR